MPRIACLLAALTLAAAPIGQARAGAGHAALQALLARGRATHSDALLVMQDGHVLGRYDKSGHPTGPLELMSVTKSVVALGIGQLLDSGKIHSLDQPVADFYSEWRKGPKRAITIRMLLDHTSGLQDEQRTGKVYAAHDAVQLALEAPLAATPGKRWFYSNKAVNLLSGIIAKAAGKPMDVFFRDGLFKAIGIHPGGWDGDDAGHPYVMAGLHLDAMDLARLGQLVADHGRWQGQRLISSAYIDAMLQPGAIGECGLLWWRRVQWVHFAPDPSVFGRLRKAGVPETTVTLLEHGLRGKYFDNAHAMSVALQRILGPRSSQILREQLVSRGIGPYRLFKLTRGPVVAYEGNGDGGQYLVVVPAARLVGVRQIAANGDTEGAGDDYGDFAARLIALAEAEGRLPPAPSPR